MTFSGPLPPDDLRNLPTSEIALRLLRSLATGDQHRPNNVFAGAKQAWGRSEPDVEYLLQRLSDAWAWLESRGLLGPHTFADGARRLTDRGRIAVEDPGGLTRITADDLLPINLHTDLGRVRLIFASGDYETAAFAAMKQVEVRVRVLAALDNSVIGVSLMRRAFKPEGGPLADEEAEGGEKVAMMELFAGAIGSFKNPASHRTVHYENPLEAAEVVLLADLLMRMLDRVAERQ